MHQAENQPEEIGLLALADYRPEQFISIHMGEGSPEIFRLTFNRNSGTVEGIIAEGASIDDAAKTFINELRFHGQSLMDIIKAADLKLDKIQDISQSYPNDMEFGSKVRQYLNDNSLNSSR